MHDKSTFYGIDPQQSREHARAMRSGAGDLSDIVGAIGSMLSQVTWTGPGAERFLQEWDGALRPELENATQNLRENAAELDRRAEMQEEASR
ncbi:hypothetical protein DNL40_15890 [Xylanimonas oleitrophica]|uniref:WXG100 family type VII secretion target n=1 Tax=Xylanimonas oleitrophica TaxID=2607479 RepID=A0A2W5WLK8_9MICO|nr:WXG100 family type VII secretion target [Xylanimonas oleitrophica]PZR51573.1 hypothetical protein DNL40_15890 [Xylanimonas oleitrophica]